MGIRKLGYTVVMARDFAVMKDWYQRALGLELAESDEGGNWAAFRFPEGGATLAIHGGVPLPVMGVMAAVVPSIEVSDIEATVAELKGRGVDFVKDVHDVAGFVRTADFKDPEGNLVQLFERVGPR